MTHLILIVRVKILMFHIENLVLMCQICSPKSWICSKEEHMCVICFSNSINYKVKKYCFLSKDFSKIFDVYDNVDSLINFCKRFSNDVFRFYYNLYFNKDCITSNSVKKWIKLKNKEEN